MNKFLKIFILLFFTSNCLSADITTFLKKQIIPTISATAVGTCLYKSFLKNNKYGALLSAAATFGITKFIQDKIIEKWNQDSVNNDDTSGSRFDGPSSPERVENSDRLTTANRNLPQFVFAIASNDGTDNKEKAALSEHPEEGYFGIFEGDLQCVNFVERYLYEYIFEYVRKDYGIIDLIGKNYTLINLMNIVNAGFIRTQEAMPESISSSSLPFDREQSASALITLLGPDCIYIAGFCGQYDKTRIIVSRDGRATSPQENNREFWVNKKSENQHRSFGKKSLNFMTADPDFFTYIFTREDQFIILGTQGIWDVINQQEAVDIINLSLSKRNDVQIAANALVDAAASKGSKYQMTVILIKLN